MIKTRLLSSLEKVFPKDKIEENIFPKTNYIFKNEKYNFQVAYSSDCWEDAIDHAQVTASSNASGVSIKLYDVKLIPSEYPTHNEIDDKYITNLPGLFPDLLKEIDTDYQISIKTFYWKSIWVEIIPDEQTTAGLYDIKLEFIAGKSVKTVKHTIEIIDAELPKQKLIYTNWIHTDCICSYYNVTPFSNSYWDLVASYLKVASEHGMNMALTPIFTPPLDTAVGCERMTIQLVDVVYKNGCYEFSFSNFKKWIDVCLKNGIEFFEISHLFTQWGAGHAPKIMANTNNGYEKIFGWDTDAKSSEYKFFLESFLKVFVETLKEMKIEKKCFFHISDEPNLSHIENYRSASEIIKTHLQDFTIIDALSNFEFYKEGLINRVVVANNHMKDFLDAKVPNLWTYYCTAQNLKVSNRFFSMPSYRNRILGLQLFKYDIEGFLHWGYNFWYTQYSKKNVNPFVETDAGCVFPSGDSFIVYPGSEYPIASLRLKIFCEALQDLRACDFLASLKGKDYVIDLIDSKLDEPVTFEAYPSSANYILELRQIINDEIKKCIIIKNVQY